MGDLLLIVPVLVFIVLVWFTYLIVNFFATIIKTKKKDKTMVCGLNTKGKIFYVVLSILYLLVFIGALYFLITGYLKNGIDSIYLPLNILTIFSIIYNFLLQYIIYFGQRQILIGRVIFDYRKIKRVTYPKATKLRFAYGQRTLETNIRFIDESLLKKALQRTR